MDFNKLCCMCHERLYIKQKFCCFGGGVQRLLHTYDCEHVIHCDCVQPYTPCPVCEDIFSSEEKELLYTPNIKIKHRKIIQSLSLERATVMFKIALKKKKLCLVEEFLVHFDPVEIVVKCIIHKHIEELKLIVLLTHFTKWERVPLVVEALKITNDPDITKIINRD